MPDSTEYPIVMRSADAIASNWAALCGFLWTWFHAVSEIPEDSARGSFRNDAFEAQEFYERRIWIDPSEWDPGFAGMREYRFGEQTGLWLMPTRFAHPDVPVGAEGLGFSVIVISQGYRESRDWAAVALGQPVEPVMTATGKPDFECVGFIPGHELGEHGDEDFLNLASAIHATVREYRSVHPLGRPERTEQEMTDADREARAATFGSGPAPV